MVVGGRHVGIPVRNLERALGFYRDQLGFRVVVDEIEAGPFIDTISGFSPARVHVMKLVAPDGWMVELLEYQDRVGKERINPKLDDLACAHVALTVSDVEAAYARLTKADIPFNSAPQFSPNGYAKVAFCRDPDGNFVELVQVMNAARSPVKKEA